ncbi:extracellular catalytic domain type 1 short-chain-length polyhydroxyalkanoate depolymerase [Hephaestia mangrovi]|uniref:extracellular catalytic domain type 1 short-chain-length polyhydroxyalkanoate depolymerase n=1 Tax=Hephaestia mangrovi TaxID=2873268 RepID=UPI002103ABB9|nr:PHB depolymerase family esterase [Hephaestia mangrovi]
MTEAATQQRTSAIDPLDQLTDFGTNPGALNARCFVPGDVSARAALVVVLHGCTQTAAGYDHGSGWSAVAQREGFALLFPEQQHVNNANLCFNWFAPEDSKRGSGEAFSIRNMIAAMIERHDLDPARVFVTGLSAGGAMASVMLATYPEVFAGGAIIAGLPFGSAANVSQALDRMRGHGGPDDAGLSALVHRASPHDGPWPTISIWHGTADATVNSTNADAILAQWRVVHGVGEEPSVSDLVDGYPHRVWHDREGRPVIEDYRITGLGHGTPLDTRGADGCGSSGAYMLEAQISSTRWIAHTWGLGEAPVDRRPIAQAEARPASPATTGVGGMIEDALRAAGLMR